MSYLKQFANYLLDDQDALSHIPCGIPRDIMFIRLLPCLVLILVNEAQGLCGDTVRWSHQVNIDDVYGVWYGVGYAQHNPDMTNKPNEIGCVSLYITDATYDVQDNWLDWSFQQRNFSDEKWRSSKSNPWSENAMAGSWLDIRLKRRARRDTSDVKRIRVLWDEDGHTLEQTYLYYPEEPGLWTAEVLRPGERQLISRGIDVWYPDDPPRHPDVIRLLKATEHTLVLNHCAELGDGGIFTLILRRSPSRVHKYEWYQYQKEFYKFELPNVYRYSAVCAAWAGLSSSLFLIISIIVLRWFS